MIDQKHLVLTLDYDPSTGIFTWKTPPTNCIQQGSEAGSIGNHGYRQIQIDGKLYLAHRLAWLYAYGTYPENQIDHRNLIRSDNRLENLRCASSSQNKFNRQKQSNNTSGFKGVSWYAPASKWRAQATIGRKYHSLGLYDSASEASLAYQNFVKTRHGEYACNRGCDD